MPVHIRDMKSLPDIIKEDEFKKHSHWVLSKNFWHHKQGLSTQITFQQHVSNLCDAIREMVNPFLDDFEDLVTLDSHSCAAESVIDTVRTLEEIDKQQ